MVIAIGLFIGSLLGLTGAGGSVFAVPLLIVLLGLGASDAMGIALGTVAVSAAYGTLVHHKQVLWLPALLITAGGLFTAPLGKYAATQLPDTALLIGFCVVAAIVAWRMWSTATQNPQAAANVRGHNIETSGKAPLMCRLSASGQFSLRPRCMSGLIGGGLLVGFASGLFGVGGGFLIVPLLLFLSQLPMSTAVATSLFCIANISAIGFASHLWLSPDINHTLLATLIATSIGGMILSQFIGRHLAGAKLQKTFAVLLMVVAVGTIIWRLL